MGKMPYLYQKMIDILNESSRRDVRKKDLEARVAQRFRINSEDAGKTIMELRKRGVVQVNGRWIKIPD